MVSMPLSARGMRLRRGVLWWERLPGSARKKVAYFRYRTPLMWYQVRLVFVAKCQG